ncbi:hypothetical protein [Sphingobacterium chuzhouense]|uniref:Uncharacterized protein n=1 Tax=Sphingobacterium chuzhouense TaxID=1742264 RepID=A0ABR7XS43_9SPHI|nr:hypothetical protein [Sphingobacterium chuzhouense]MBD1421989.1 hypothetical protein [Sphingobacterium chuzhouense]
MEWIKSLKQFFKLRSPDVGPAVNNSVVTFSGLFSYTKSQKRDIQKRTGYYQTKKEKFVVNIIQSQYYKVFRKFVLNDCPEDYLEICSPNSYSVSVDAGNEFQVEVENIKLSFFDDEIGLGIYSFSVRSVESLSFKEFIQIFGRFRNLDAKVAVGRRAFSIREFIELNMLRCENNPVTKNIIKIDEKSELYNYSGSKLKAFIAVELTEFNKGYTIDEALFELGTFTEYSTSKKNKNLYSPSSEYFDYIVSKKISVFSNWSALALFDSFVIIGKEKYLIDSTRKTLSDSYFKIFIFNLYSKFYLFKANSNLGNVEGKPHDHKLYSFLRKYNITHISYNFLPNLLHSKIREALQIDSELKSVKSKIELIESQAKEKETNLINVVLLFIAAFGIISILSDFPTVYENIVNDGEKKIATFIALGIVLIAIVGVVCYYKVYKRNSG